MSNEVDIKVTASGGSKAAQEIQAPVKSAHSLQDSISGIGSTARGLLAANFIGEIGEHAKKSFSEAVEAASSLSESMNAVDRIFGASSAAIHKFGAEQANAIGLSQRAFNELATPLGASLRNAGIEMGKTSDMTIMLTKRAADMASVFNTDVQGALEDIQSALRGEADPIEKYGVAVNELAVQHEALAMSGKKSVTELTNQDKALARVSIIMKQTDNLAGDFAATQGGLANSTRIANAEIEEAKAKLGQGLLPIMAQGAHIVGVFADGFGKLPGPVQTTAGLVLGLGAAFVFLAPKLIAARDAWKELDIGFGKSDTKLGRLTGHLIATGGKLAAVAAGAQVASVAFGDDLNPQIDELAESLAKYNTKAGETSEATRLLGKDFAYFKDNAYVFKHDGWTKAAAGITTFEEDWLGLSNVLDDSHRKTTERLQALDAALAHLVQQGRTAEAKQQFDALAESVKDAGVTVDDIKQSMPQYAAAQAAASRATQATSTAIQGEAISLKDLHNALKAQTDPIFALIQAQNDLTDAQKNYNTAIRENGAKSPEAAQALRDMAEAAINLSGAVNDAQGVFNGKLTPALKQVLHQAGLTDAMIAQLEAQFIATTAAGNAFAKNYEATVTVHYRDPGLNQGHKQQLIDMGRASGGPASGRVLVGEGGKAEIVDFESRQVFNPSDTQRMLSQGGDGGSNELHIFWHFTGADREFITMMKRIVDQQGGGSVVKAFSRQQFQNA